MNIPALTGVRFFAAAAIVLHHSQISIFFREDAFKPFSLGGAVPFFFVLSGFVLSINAAKYRSWSDFFVARIARIWPAHAAAVAFLFAIFWPYSKMLLWDDPGQFRILFVNLALLQDWSPDRAVYMSLNAPSWSVSVEMFFYALFPALLLATRRNPWLTVSATVSFAIVFQSALAALRPDIDQMWLGHFNPAINLPSFAIGVAAGEIFKSSPAPQSRIGAAYQFAALALMTAGNAFFASITAELFPAPYGIFISTIGAAPFYAVLIVAMARFDGPASRFLSRPSIVFLGEISYSVYLFHQLVFRWHSDKLSLFEGLPPVVQYAGVIVATMAISAACYFVIERPCRKLIIALWRNRFLPRISYDYARTNQRPQKL